MFKPALHKNCNYVVVNCKKFFCNVHSNAQILSDMIGIPKGRAKSYIERYRLRYKEGDLLVQNIRYCQKLGYTRDDILGNRKLLTTHPVELEHHYWSLEEGGFIDIGPKILARARTYMKKVIAQLKVRALISEETNVPQRFLSYINKDTAEKIPIDHYSDKNVWNLVHLEILQKFLKLELDATQDEIITLFRIYKMIPNKSFRVIQENIALALEMGFERRKILRYGYILHNYPTYAKATLRDIPNLAGADMRRAMRLYPKLMMTSPTNMIKIYGILKEFDIKDEVMRKQMNVFHLSPETVRLRLEEISRSPDLRTLMKHPKLLALVVHHNRAKSRLSFLQQLQLKCTSFIILKTHENESFEEYIREGKDINKVNDVLIFCNTLFDVDLDQVKKRLKCHPFYLKVPLKRMQETYDYLVTQRFRKDSIIKTMPIILYPVEKIEQALKELQNNPEVNFTPLNQVSKLNLVLYTIEKEHHFTGNGIWTKSDIIEISEKILE